LCREVVDSLKLTDFSVHGCSRDRVGRPIVFMRPSLHGDGKPHHPFSMVRTNSIGSRARRNKCCDLASLTLSIFLAPSLVSTFILVYFVGRATRGRRSTTGYCVHLVGHSTSFRSGHAGSGSHPYEFHFPPCSVFCVSDPRGN
jgi:hypothetical protein